TVAGIPRSSWGRSDRSSRPSIPTPRELVNLTRGSGCRQVTPELKLESCKQSSCSTCLPVTIHVSKPLSPGKDQRTKTPRNDDDHSKTERSALLEFRQGQRLGVARPSPATRPRSRRA